MIIQWIGVALTVVGLVFNGYKQLQNNQTQSQNQTYTQNTVQVQSSQPTVQYSTVNIAYDHATGKHYFQHPNGQWFDFPPKP